MVPPARLHLEKFQASASRGVDGGYPGLSRCSQHLKGRPARCEVGGRRDEGEDLHRKRDGQSGQTGQ